MLTLWIRVGSRSKIFWTSTSNPSSINIGRLALPLSDCLDMSEASSEDTLVCPRKVTSGTEFGLEPALMFSFIRKEGSNVWIADMKLFGLTFMSSSFLIFVVFPEKPSLRIGAYPVTMTSSRLSLASTSATSIFACWLIFTRLVSYPRQENSRIPPFSGRLSE